VWNSDQQFLARQTIHFRFKKIQRNGQTTYSEPLILHAFFEETRQSFNFFLKLQTCTYFQSFNKNPDPGLFECGNLQKLTPRGYNKIQEPPNTWFRRQTRCGLSLLNIETKFACCWLVSLTMQGFVLPGPFAWALALVKPNTSGFTQGAQSFPLHILHHAGSFIGSN
jgi:hypothetical protein